MIDLSSKTEPNSKTCPKCKFSGSPENFPQGFASQNINFNGKIYPVKHCPKCGYWDEQQLESFKKVMEASS